MREEMRNIEWNVELESLGTEEAWNLFKEQVDPWLRNTSTLVKSTLLTDRHG